MWEGSGSPVYTQHLSGSRAGPGTPLHKRSVGPSFSSARVVGWGECRGRRKGTESSFHCQKGKCGVSEGRGTVGLLTAGGSLGEIELFALRRAFSSDRVSAGETFTKNPRQ